MDVVYYVNHLPIQERVEVVNRLKADLDAALKNEGTQPTTRAEELLDVMAKLCGYKIDINSRAPMFSIPRNIVINQMLKEGVPVTDIAHQVNKNRTMVYYARELVQQLLSQKSMAEYAQLYYAFTNEVNNDKANRQAV